MDVKSLYNIAFKGLGQGEHDFNYKIDNKFFALFEDRIVDGGIVNVDIVLEKQSSLMVLWFNIDGHVDIECDRCLEMYKQHITGKNRIYVKFGEETIDEGDDIVWVSTNDYQLNVTQLIYEFICLALPIKHVHPSDKNGHSTCNPEMIERIDKHVFTEDDESYDSRWEELKKLLDNN